MKSLACGMNHHSFRVTSDVDVPCRCPVHLHTSTRVCVSPRERRNDADAGLVDAAPGFYLARIGLHDRHLISRARAQWDTPYLLPLRLRVPSHPYTFRSFVGTLKRDCTRQCHLEDYYRRYPRNSRGGACTLEFHEFPCIRRV